MSLGFWQLDRAEQKRDLLKSHEEAQQAEPLPLTVEHLQYDRVKTAGEYDNKHQFLLDNQFSHHRLGYQVITPLRLSNEKIVLVNRGWIPRERKPGVLPVLTPVLGYQQIHGMIDIPSGKGLLLGAIEENPGRWPRLIEKIEISSMKKGLGEPVYPFIIRLDKDVPDGFERNWVITTMPPARHTGYAVQWFALALTLVIIYLVVNIRNRSS